MESKSLIRYAIVILKLVMLMAIVTVWQGGMATNTLQLHTPVKDSLTKRDLSLERYVPFVELYSARDTSLVATSFNRRFDLTNPEEKYFLHVMAYDVLPDNKIGGETEDLADQWVTLDLSGIAGLQAEYTAPAVFLHRHMRKDLKEVTVTPSRIMFYHKGDTLVYNASAFVLAEGSMIDALINQLPGVRIDSN